MSFPYILCNVHALSPSLPLVPLVSMTSFQNKTPNALLLPSITSPHRLWSSNGWKLLVPMLNASGYSIIHDSSSLLKSRTLFSLSELYSDPSFSTIKAHIPGSHNNATVSVVVWRLARIPGRFQNSQWIGLKVQNRGKVSTLTNPFQSRPATLTLLETSRPAASFEMSRSYKPFYWRLSFFI